MSTRTDLAAAASTVEGVTAHAYYVQGTQPGHTFVRLERVEYPNPFGGVAHWNVVVVLPQDLAAAEQWIDQKVPLIKAAIEPHLVVTSAVPQRLQITGVGDLPCVFINGHCEGDQP